MTSSSNTTWKFDGTEDIIDSREIMERIEELEAKVAELTKEA